MRKRQMIFLPLLTLVLGVVGWFLRQKQLVTGFDAQGLSVPGDRWALALIVLSVATALLLALLVARLKPREELDATALALHGPAYPVVMLLASAALLAGALIGFVSVRGGERDVLRVDVLSLCALVAAVCTAVFSLTLYRRGDPKKCGILAVLPVFFLCIWLIIAYREQAANPVKLAFIYEILAIICGTLGFYYVASMIFTRPRPRAAVFFGLLCIYFILVCVEETGTISDYLYFAFLALSMMGWSVSLLRNAFQ